MHGTTEFAAFLALYREVHASSLTADERGEVLALARVQFQSRAHDERLQAIVERLCREAPSDQQDGVECAQAHPAEDEPEGAEEPAAEGPAPRPVVSRPGRGRKALPRHA